MSFLGSGLALPLAGYGASPGLPPEYRSSIRAFQDYRTFLLTDRILSPIPEVERDTFTGPDFYPVDTSLVLPAMLEKTGGRRTVALPIFGGGTADYVQVGILSTRLEGQPVRLLVYRRPPGSPGRPVLLVPFRDATNGHETYAGGRYIELEEGDSSSLWLDFNRAVNPLCAYNPEYACPIPPSENTLSLAIRAGERRYR